MEKKDLLKKIDDVKAKIKANSKDQHFADTLIEQLLLFKGQYDVKPIEFNLGERIRETKGDTFEIVETTQGVVFRTYSGYTLFADPKQVALYNTLMDIVEGGDAYKDLQGEEKEQIELAISAIAYCLLLPTYAFYDASFIYDTASSVVSFLQKQFEKYSSVELQDETPVENAEYEKMETELEEVKNTILKDIE